MSHLSMQMLKRLRKLIICGVSQRKPSQVRLKPQRKVRRNGSLAYGDHLRQGPCSLSL